MAYMVLVLEIATTVAPGCSNKDSSTSAVYVKRLPRNDNRNLSTSSTEKALKNLTEVSKLAGETALSHSFFAHSYTLKQPT